MLLAASIGVCLAPPRALSQAASSAQVPGETPTTTSGTVVSASANVLVLSTGQGHEVFIFDRYTAKPAKIAPGSTVRVLSRATGEPGVRLATDVILSAGPTGGQQKESTDAVPVAVRQLENDIERQARKYGMGFRAGAGLDPEVLLVGVHAKIGPFFTQNASFRPNAEFAWGEVTKLFALNLEGIYRLPFTPRLGRWSAYAGAGPSFVFARESFERFTGVEEPIDFGDFDFDVGLNILAGMEFRSGLFFEVKSTVYAQPHLRLILGYTF
jgi:hypothetical protein